MSALRKRVCPRFDDPQFELRYRGHRVRVRVRVRARVSLTLTLTLTLTPGEQELLYFLS